MPDASTTVAELREKVRCFVDEREWRPYHDAKNLSMSIAIEAAELLEHFQWSRNEELAAVLREPGRRDAIIEEMADVACYLFALANVLDVDLSDALSKKLVKNAEKYPVEQFRGRYYKPGRGDGQTRT